MTTTLYRHELVRPTTRRRRTAAQQRRQAIGRELRVAIVRAVLVALAVPCVVVWHLLSAVGFRLDEPKRYADAR